MRTDLALDALEQAIHACRDDALAGLVHHTEQVVHLGFTWSLYCALASSILGCDEAMTPRSWATAPTAWPSSG